MKRLKVICNFHIIFNNDIHCLKFKSKFSWHSLDKNELKRHINTTLGGVLHTPSQSKNQIFIRQTHV